MYFLIVFLHYTHASHDYCKKIANMPASSLTIVLHDNQKNLAVAFAFTNVADDAQDIL